MLEPLQQSSAAARSGRRGIDPPSPFPPAGGYVNAVRTGDLLILGGHIPFSPPETIVRGKLGPELDIEGGRRAIEVTLEVRR
ncbi:MAG: hypothetical protein FGM52_04950 [Mycobacterium sp.]|nr:hypothetical protein [Mycobacterium sp.]